MAVFAVFLCGTGSNSWDTHNPNYPDGELISTLASHHTGSEFVDWTIIDGPGSGNLQEDDKWVTPGNYSKKRGELTGAGWEENVAHAVAMIKGNYEWSRAQLTKAEYEALVKEGIELDDPQRVGPFTGELTSILIAKSRRRNCKLRKRRSCARVHCPPWST